MKRPTGVTVFAVLNLIFATFGLLGVALNMVHFVLPEAEPKNRLQELAHGSMLMSGWMQLSSVLNALAAIALLVAAIGLLRMLNWARVTSVVYAAYTIIMTVLGIFITTLAVFSPALAQAPRGEQAFAVGAVVGAFFAGLLAIGYAAVMGYYLSRPQIVAAFEEASRANRRQRPRGESTPRSPLATPSA